MKMPTPRTSAPKWPTSTRCNSMAIGLEGSVTGVSAVAQEGDHSACQRMLSRGLLGIAPLKSLVITVDERMPKARAPLSGPASRDHLGHHGWIIAGSGAAENARRATRSFAAAEASNADRAINGTATPRTSSKRRWGKRSILANGRRSTHIARGASPSASSRRMPMPRISMRPAIAAGALTHRRFPARHSSA